MRVLLLGANGQVGWELHRLLPVLVELVVTSRDGRIGQALDLTDLVQVESFLQQLKPDLIINAAAFTQVDLAEDEIEQAYRLNAELPALLADYSRQQRVPLLHYSTDYVFDGCLKKTAYQESHSPNPQSVYGASKWAGDQAILQTASAGFILRVGWVYSQRGNNFLLTMMRLMQERDQLSIVDDQWGAPTRSRDIAIATLLILCRLMAQRNHLIALDSVALYHLSPMGFTSWYGFACEIKRLGGYETELVAIPAADYPSQAVRPANSRLDASALQRDHGIALPDWKESVQQCMDDLSALP